MVVFATVSHSKYEWIFSFFSRFSFLHLSSMLLRGYYYETKSQPIAEMGEMGKRLVQERISALFENDIVQGKTQFIRTLVIGMSMKVITFNVIY